MRGVIDYCEEKKCYCLISNPSIDFWLLLHLSDVKNEYKERLEDIRENKRLSDKHTFVSREVSTKTHNGKKAISDGTFNGYYLSNIDTAIKRAKGFAEKPREILENIGTSIPELFTAMRE